MAFDLSTPDTSVEDTVAEMKDFPAVICIGYSEKDGKSAIRVAYTHKDMLFNRWLVKRLAASMEERLVDHVNQLLEGLQPGEAEELLARMDKECGDESEGEGDPDEDWIDGVREGDHVRGPRTGRRDPPA